MPRSSQQQTRVFWTVASALTAVLVYQVACLWQRQPLAAPQAKPSEVAHAFTHDPQPTWVPHSPVCDIPPAPIDPRLAFKAAELHSHQPAQSVKTPTENSPVGKVATAQPETTGPVLPDLPDINEPTLVAPAINEPIADKDTEDLANELPVSPDEISAPLPATLSSTPARVHDVEEFDEAAQRAANTSVEEMLAYFPAENELSEQFRDDVQQAFTLARNGALHAARREFERLLSEMAKAKDASQMTDRHSRALAAGLRAMAEADDFLAAGDETGTPAALALGHQTPMLHEPESKWVLRHEAIAMYHLYAQQKLADAVLGEQAGSMVLFGLGKTYAHLAERDDLPQAIRKSLTMYRAAVGAHGQNHLAANEAGVLLARAGRYRQAAPLLELAAQLGNASATHRNLAFVHQKLGDTQLASTHQQIATYLSQREIAQGKLSAERGIAWISPDQFNRTGQQTPPAAELASRPFAAPTPTSAGAVRQPEPPREPAPRPSFWW